MFQREKCLICCESLNESQHLHTFEKFPVYMGISTAENYKEDLAEDMIWAACNSCGTVQLQYLIEPEVLYQRAHNPSIGTTWQKHHDNFAEFVLKFAGKQILEIGGGNKQLQSRVLKSNFIEKYTVCDVHGYDITSNDVRACQITDYIDSDTQLNVECDTIVHSHTFEHFYEPNVQLRLFASLLQDGQRMIMSVPDVAEMVKDNFTNGLNFEHTFMLSRRNLEFLLKVNGFEIEAIHNYSPHNLFVSCIRSTEEVVALEQDLSEMKTFLGFVDYYQKEASRIQNLLDNTDREAFLFGCHIFSQYLLSFGIHSSDIVSVLDNDPGKIGYRLYGTPLMTQSPKVLSEIDAPIVILKAGVYTEEIKNDILSNHNKNTEFIT